MNLKASNKFLFNQEIKCENCKWSTEHCGSLRCTHNLAINISKSYGLHNPGIHTSWARYGEGGGDKNDMICGKLGSLYTPRT